MDFSRPSTFASLHNASGNNAHDENRQTYICLSCCDPAVAGTKISRGTVLSGAAIQWLSAVHASSGDTTDPGPPRESLREPAKEHVERCHAMALDQSAMLEVLDALKAADVGDRVRAAAETVYQALIEAELTDLIGAAPHERSAERSNLRNGHRTRTLTTTAGDLELRIPKLRTGSFFPSPLERRRVDGAVRGGHGGLPARRVHTQGR
jgi:Transposase, Mutator family